MSRGDRGEHNIGRVKLERKKVGVVLFAIFLASTTLFLFSKAVTLKREGVLPYKVLRIATEEGYHIVRYRTVGYFTPAIFSSGPAEGYRFINQSDQPLALRFRPSISAKSTHADFPALEKGETLDVVFNKRGVWHYFNNIKPKASGIIYVR